MEKNFTIKLSVVAYIMVNMSSLHPGDLQTKSERSSQNIIMTKKDISDLATAWNYASLTFGWIFISCYCFYFETLKCTCMPLSFLHVLFFCLNRSLHPMWNNNKWNYYLKILSLCRTCTVKGLVLELHVTGNYLVWKSGEHSST